MLKGKNVHLKLRQRRLELLCWLLEQHRLLWRIRVNNGADDEDWSWKATEWFFIQNSLFLNPEERWNQYWLNRPFRSIFRINNDRLRVDAVWAGQRLRNQSVTANGWLPVLSQRDTSNPSEHWYRKQGQSTYTGESGLQERRRVP